jgi:hypothetical protein
MDEELSMYRQQVKSFKEDLLSLDDEMTKVKRRWFKQKKAAESN